MSNTGSTPGDDLLQQPHLDAVVAALRKDLDADYRPPNIKRHAHPKIHGCVQAVLRVDEDLPGDLRQGIFANPPPDGYLAWVRFSNAFGLQHDLRFESRGMAIKVLGVSGGDRLHEKQAPFSWETDTQDFVLAVHDTFVLPNTTDFKYEKFSQAARDGFGALLTVFAHHRLWRGLRSLILGGLKVARNPLALVYFSQTAYRFGPHTVKVRARPILKPALRRSLPNAVVFFLKMVLANALITFGEVGKMPALLKFFGLAGTREAAELFVDRHIGSRHGLRHAMTTYLASHPAVFEIGIQKQEKGMPDDNPTVSWSQSKSPFLPVATLTIPRQVFWPSPGMPPVILKAAKDMVDLGEQMSFSPWHGLTAHEPLGDINRARGRIYAELSRFRRGENLVTPNDPSGESTHVVHEYERLRDVVQHGLMEDKRRSDIVQHELME